uniref:Proteasomal ubiquitin receptor ADRM1 homolog n=1 Tax=Globodera rostochiensis TaxID=31243 RepID=A0A914HHE1_GLORO
MSVMFASTRGQSTTGTGNLLEFKAGRTLIEPGSTPEKRRAVANPDLGLVYIKHSQDDQLLHLCWQNRKKKDTELDLIIFPGETEFKRINECKNGRVFMLKFKNSEERHLFWMQEPEDAKKDDEICKKMNDLLSNAPPTRPAAGGGRTPTDRAGTMERYAALSNAIGGNLEDIGALGNMDQNQLMRLFSLMNGGASVTPAELANLGQIASGAKAEDGGGAAAVGVPPEIGSISALMGRSGQQKGQNSSQQNAKGEAAAEAITPQLLDKIIKAATANVAATSKEKVPSVDLSSFLTRANTQETVSNNKELLKPLLPDQKPLQNADAELAQTVGNPQFRQTADFFGHALQMGQLSDALEQFGFRGEVVNAAKKGDIQQFVEKLTEQENPKKAEVEKAIKKAADAEQADTAESATTENKKDDEENPSPCPSDDDGMDRKKRTSSGCGCI